MLETQVLFLGQEDPLEKGMATHTSVPAWIPWTEEPGGLQSAGLQRVGHDWATDIYTDTNSQGLREKKCNSKTQLDTGTCMLFLTKERWFELQGMINHGEPMENKGHFSKSFLNASPS